MAHQDSSLGNGPPASAWYESAVEALKTGRGDDARKVCLDAIESFKASDESRQLSAAYHFLGDMENRRRDFDEAERWYKMAIACDELTGDERGRAKTLNNLSVVATSRGDYEVAKQWLEDSLRIKEKQGDKPGLAYGYHQRGVIASYEGNEDEAERWYKRSLDIKEDAGGSVQLAYTYFALMDVADSRGDASAVSGWKTKAVAALGKVDDVRRLLNWAYDADQRESMNEAQAVYARVCELANEQGDEEVESCCYNRLGRVAVKLGCYDLARRCFSNSLALDERLETKEREESNKKWLDWLVSNSA